MGILVNQRCGHRYITNDRHLSMFVLRSPLSVQIVAISSSWGSQSLLAVKKTTLRAPELSRTCGFSWTTQIYNINFIPFVQSSSKWPNKKFKLLKLNFFRGWKRNESSWKFIFSLFAKIMKWVLKNIVYFLKRHIHKYVINNLVMKYVYYAVVNIFQSCSVNI